MLTIEEVRNTIGKEEIEYVKKETGYKCDDINEAVKCFAGLKLNHQMSGRYHADSIPASSLDIVNQILNMYDALLHDLKLTYVNSK